VQLGEIAVGRGQACEGESTAASTAQPGEELFDRQLAAYLACLPPCRGLASDQRSDEDMRAVRCGRRFPPGPSGPPIPSQGKRLGLTTLCDWRNTLPRVRALLTLPPSLSTGVRRPVLVGSRERGVSGEFRSPDRVVGPSNAQPFA